MRALVAFCLRMRFVVALACLVTFALGVWVSSKARVDVFPEFAPARVEIQTEAPGLSALEVETLVTAPIERAVQGVALVSALRSKSVLGLSSVVLIFEEGADLLRARQLVQERLGAAQLPTGSLPPRMLSPLSSMSRVMKIGVSSPTLSQMEMTDLVRFVVRPQLMAVSGVANVAVWGERVRRLQVNVDPQVLRARGARLDQVLKAARDATTPSAAGYVDTPNQRMAVTHAPFATSPESLGEVVVSARANGAPIRLADVAEVDEGFATPIGDAIIDGAPGLLLIIEKQPWGNTLEVTRNVEAALAKVATAAPGVSFDPTIFRPATFIERALVNLRHAVLLGCVLVVIILVLFLHDFRTALISVIAIPLSLVAATTVLAWRGVTIDTMIVAGLVIALGEIVDDAIIDVENIVRRLALNAATEEPRPAFEVVLEASLEVRSAVVYATAIVLLAFLPIYFMDGLAGTFFRPLAIAYALSVFASLAVALIVTPALALILLPKSAPADRHGPLHRIARRAYAPTIAWAVGHARASTFILGGTLALTVAAVPFLGEGFLPSFHETDFLMHWLGRPGTSIEEMDRITMRVSHELRAIPGVRNFGAHVGRAEAADEVVGPNFTELWISLDEKADYAASVARLRSVVDGYPGIYRDVQTYLQERVKEVLSGASGSIVVRIYGDDLDVLRAKADEVGKVIEKIPGVANAKVEPQVLVPQIEIALDPQALQRFGLTPGDVRRTIATLLQGTRVGEVTRGDRVVDVVVLGVPAFRRDVAAVRDLRIEATSDTASPGGGGSHDVRLGDIASVTIVSAPNVVQRDSAARRIDVTCDAHGRDLGGVADDVTQAIRGVSFPPGHRAEVLGEYAARQAARTNLFGLGFLALLGIGVVLYADFRSGRIVAFLMATLPFALVGAVAAVFATGGIVSMGSLVGFVTVLGIAARNGIMLVSHFRRLEEEGMPFGAELVIRGAMERVVPILMTALATGLALVPLAISGERPGYETEHPMAIVILGGLVSSTLLNLLVVPGLYLRFGRDRRVPAAT